jgi:small GTP-binding protein
MLANLKIFGSGKTSIKILALGPPNVGKTTALYKLYNFNYEIEPSRSILADHLVDESESRLKLYYNDISSCEVFSTISYLNINEADIILLFFDIMNADSFRSVINDWYKNIINLCTKTQNKITFFLIGNKSDLIKTDIDKMRPNDPRDYAMENGINFYLLNKYDNELYIKLKQDIIKTGYLVTQRKKVHLYEKEIQTESSSYNKEHINNLFIDLYGSNWRDNTELVDIYNKMINKNTYSFLYNNCIIS